MTITGDALAFSESTRRRLANAAQSFAILLGIFAAFYAVELTSFQLSIDDEYAVYRESADIWVQQGRFTVYVLERFLFSYPVIPFFPHAVFGVFVSLAYLVVLRTCGVRQLGLVHFVLFPLFAAFPTWSFLLEFLPNTPAEGLGVFVTSCAIATFARHLVSSQAQPGQRGIVGWLGRLALAGLLGAIALGAYQSNVLLLLVLGLGVILTDAFRKEVSLGQLLRGFGALALLTAVTVGLYTLVLRGFMFSLDLEPTYTERFIKVNQLLGHPMRVIRLTLVEGVELYGGDPVVYGTHAFGFGMVVLLGLAAVVVAPSMTGRPMKRVAVILLAVAALLAPLGLNFLSRGHVPFRSLVAFPAAVWLFGFLGLTVGGRWIARATLVAVLLAALQTQYVASLFHAGAAMVREHDRALATSIHDRIEAVHPNFSRTSDHKVEFYGAIRFRTEFPQIEGSTRAKSFFEWAGGRPDRVVWYMRLIGYDHLRDISEKERIKLTPILEKMPVWPAPGCVRVVGDVTLVRLGRKPGLYHRKTSARSARALPSTVAPDTIIRRPPNKRPAKAGKNRRGQNE